MISKEGLQQWWNGLGTRIPAIPARSDAEKGLTQQLKYNHEQSVDR
jgi:hypothetical protein